MFSRLLYCQWLYLRQNKWCANSNKQRVHCVCTNSGQKYILSHWNVVYSFENKALIPMHQNLSFTLVKVIDRWQYKFHKIFGHYYLEWRWYYSVRLLAHIIDQIKWLNPPTCSKSYQPRRRSWTRPAERRRSPRPSSRSPNRRPRLKLAGVIQTAYYREFLDLGLK